VDCPTDSASLNYQKKNASDGIISALPGYSDGPQRADISKNASSLVAIINFKKEGSHRSAAGMPMDADLNIRMLKYSLCHPFSVNWLMNE
jgi:hypothetical protein